MDRPAYLFIWILVVICMMSGFFLLEAFLLDDLEAQINEG